MCYITNLKLKEVVFKHMRTNLKRRNEILVKLRGRHYRP
jgi:hypothetical protein